MSRLSDNISRFIDTTQLDTARRNYEHATAQIRRDPNLSDTGKRNQIAKAHIKAANEIHELRQQFKANVSAEKARIQRRVFGPGSADPNDIVSHRDALTRATALTTQGEALQLLEWAEISGDTALSRAVAFQAHRSNWDEAIAEHDRQHPGAASSIQELSDLPELSGENGAIAESIVFKLTAADELRTTDDSGIEHLAVDQ